MYQKRLVVLFALAFALFAQTYVVQGSGLPPPGANEMADASCYSMEFVPKSCLLTVDGQTIDLKLAWQDVYYPSPPITWQTPAGDICRDFWNANYQGIPVIARFCSGPSAYSPCKIFLMVYRSGGGRLLITNPCWIYLN